MALAGLADVARRRVDRLSGGQIQRLRFALVAVANPDVLVLDEPTRALDVAGRREFWSAMRAYAAAGRTVLFATHYLDEVDENADRVVVVVMVGGRIVADATLDAVRRRAGSSVIKLRLPDETRLPEVRALLGVRARRGAAPLHYGQAVRRPPASARSPG